MVEDVETLNMRSQTSYNQKRSRLINKMDTEILDMQDTMSAQAAGAQVSAEASPDVQQFYRTATIETTKKSAADPSIKQGSPKKRDTVLTQKTVLFASQPYSVKEEAPSHQA